MSTRAAVSSVDVSVPAPADDSGAASRPRISPETEADKVRRQMHLRRKIKLARRALTAGRR
jgi:hypothetical protein